MNQKCVYDSMEICQSNFIWHDVGLVHAVPGYSDKEPYNLERDSTTTYLDYISTAPIHTYT